MKKGILLLLLISSVAVHAQQSLKDLLFSGKLKNDPGVIRKGDDLSAWMKTSSDAPTTNTTMNSVRTETTTVMAPESLKRNPVNENTNAPVTSSNTAPVTPSNTDSSNTAPPAEESVSSKNSAAAKSNTTIWKEYMTNIANVLKAEVLPSKKIKKDTYTILVSYSIATDGQTTVTDVFVSPENQFLQQSIKDRLTQDLPKLSPTLSDSGVPRKTNKKYSFSITKE